MKNKLLKKSVSYLLVATSITAPVVAVVSCSPTSYNHFNINSLSTAFFETQDWSGDQTENKALQYFLNPDSVDDDVLHFPKLVKLSPSEASRAEVFQNHFTIHLVDVMNNNPAPYNYYAVDENTYKEAGLKLNKDWYQSLMSEGFLHGIMPEDVKNNTLKFREYMSNVRYSISYTESQHTIEVNFYYVPMADTQLTNWFKDYLLNENIGIKPNNRGNSEGLSYVWFDDFTPNHIRDWYHLDGNYIGKDIETEMKANFHAITKRTSYVLKSDPVFNANGELETKGKITLKPLGADGVRESEDYLAMGYSSDENSVHDITINTKNILIPEDPSLWVEFNLHRGGIQVIEQVNVVTVDPKYYELVIEEGNPLIPTDPVWPTESSNYESLSYMERIEDAFPHESFAHVENWQSDWEYFIEGVSGLFKYAHLWGKIAPFIVRVSPSLGKAISDLTTLEEIVHSNGCIPGTMDVFKNYQIKFTANQSRPSSQELGHGSVQLAFDDFATYETLEAKILSSLQESNFTATGSHVYADITPENMAIATNDAKAEAAKLYRMFDFYRGFYPELINDAGVNYDTLGNFIVDTTNDQNRGADSIDSLITRPYTITPSINPFNPSNHNAIHTQINLATDFLPDVMEYGDIYSTISLENLGELIKPILYIYAHKDYIIDYFHVEM